MTGPAAADFPEFFAACHDGHAPFRWQSDLVAEVLGRGRWPDAVDIPTGLGKTSLLDAAVFVTAASGVGPAGPGRRRVFFVVDRRIVVDEAWQQADMLAATLARAAADGSRDDVVARVSRRLAGLAPDCGGRPLVVTRMRGGATWSADWLDRPDRFGIVAGTVDQVGSRFFFRGYGLNSRRAPIDAALVGTDSLILLDEAHLADSLLISVSDARRLDSSSLPVPAPHLITLSATGRGSDAAWTFTLDVEAHLADRQAAQRLSAAKELTLRPAPKGRTTRQIATEAVRLAGESTVDTLLVVCNTVPGARAVHGMVATALGAQASVLLLTGRSRPVDRDRLVAEVLARMALGRDRSTSAVPMVLVATQTIEVGANIDADALVTQAAPLDSLIQRLGRANRIGRAPHPAPIVVVGEDGADDPVYGAATAAAWRFLTERAATHGDPLPAGPLAVRAWRHTAPPDAHTVRPGTPIMLSPILDSWVRTGPVPVPDTPVAPYLHGFAADRPEVTLAWRDDLEWLNDDQLAGRLLALPPAAEEQVDVPFGAFRRWLAGDGETAALSDVDSTGAATAELPTGGGLSRPVAVVRDGSWRWQPAADVHPGEAVVLPAGFGGLDRYGWNPAATDQVTDAAERAHVHRRPALRVDRRTSHRLGVAGTPDGDRLDTAISTLLAAIGQGEPTDEPIAAIWSALDPISAASDGWVRNLVALIRGAVPRVIDEQQVVLRGATARLAGPTGDPERDDSRETGSSAAPRPVTLTQHGKAVGARARQIATNLCLPSHLVAAVALAAEWHDLGKAEPRFQAMLHRGDRLLAALASEPLAKSGMVDEDPDAYRLARVRSGLPAGARHEAWSARAAQTLLEGPDPSRWLPPDADPELVIHLVASHHGHSRPLLPPVTDTDPTTFTVTVDGASVAVASTPTIDWQAPARFRRLNDRYGRWGLALLEAIVRQADITCSRDGS